MAKEKNKNTTKSFVMLIVTGVVLAAVTLCWFASTNSSNVWNDQDSAVENDASSKANIYYGVDENGDVAIRKDDVVKYEMVQDEIISTENIIPGGEYFFMAQFANCDAGKKIILSFDDVGGSLSSYIQVTRKIALVDSEGNETVLLTTPAEGDGATFLNSIANKPLEYTIVTGGKYKLYYSFKVADSTTISMENQRIGINNVNIVVSE